MSFQSCVALSVVTLLAGCGAETAVQRSVAPLPATAVIRDGSLMSPGRPQIAPLPATAVPGPQLLRWNMWWGENGGRWRVLVNGKAAGTGALTVLSPRQQQGSLDLQFDKPGRYEIRVALCNDHGCSQSRPTLLEVVPG
jgi:hypothetical protein